MVQCVDCPDFKTNERITPDGSCINHPDPRIRSHFGSVGITKNGKTDHDCENHPEMVEAKKQREIQEAFKQYHHQQRMLGIKTEKQLFAYFLEVANEGDYALVDMAWEKMFWDLYNKEGSLLYKEFPTLKVWKDKRNNVWRIYF